MFPEILASEWLELMSNGSPNSPDAPPPQPKWLASVALTAVLAALALVILMPSPTSVTTTSYSEIKELIRSGQVRSALLEEHAITVDTGDSPVLYKAITPAQGDDDLLQILEETQVEITAKEPRGISVFSYILPWLLFLGLYVWLQRQTMNRMGGGFGTGGLQGLFSGRFAKPSERTSNVTFDDVAGQDQAKKEVR